MLRVIVVVVALLAAASAYNFKLEMGDIVKGGGDPTKKLRTTRVDKGKSRDLTFGMGIYAKGNKPFSLKEVKFWVQKDFKGSCELRTRDTSGNNKRHIKQWGVKTMEEKKGEYLRGHHWVKAWKTEKGQVKAIVKDGAKLLTKTSGTKVDPKKTYPLNGGKRGGKGEIWVGWKVRVSRNGNLCDLCKVHASATDGDGVRRYTTEPYVIRLGDRECPNNAKYLK